DQAALNQANELGAGARIEFSRDGHAGLPDKATELSDFSVRTPSPAPQSEFRGNPTELQNEVATSGRFGIAMLVRTRGVKDKNLFLLGLFRRRLEYPALNGAVREQQSLFHATVVLIEDKASGTQLI